LIGEKQNASPYSQQASLAGIAVPVAPLALAGIAIAARAVGDNALALLHYGPALVATLHIDGGFSPAVADAITVELFLVGVVSGLSGFTFSTVAAFVLWLLPVLQAVPLIMLLSRYNQLPSVGTLRQEMVLRSTAERERAVAFVAGGLVGVPIGLRLLQTPHRRVFRFPRFYDSGLSRVALYEQGRDSRHLDQAASACSGRCQASRYARQTRSSFDDMLVDIHSSGTPALRRPAKYMVSTKLRTFGTPQDSTARNRAMLE
jgi:hypothetical protein